MKQIETKKDVISFGIFNEVVYQTTNHNIVIENKEIPFNQKAYFLKFDNKIFIDDKEGNYIIINDKIEILESGFGKAFFFLSKNVIGIQKIVENGILSLLSKNGFNHFFEILNLKSHGIYSIYSDNKFIYKNSNQEISILNLETKNNSIFHLKNLNKIEEQEEYQLSEFSEIYKNTLVCTLNNGGIILYDIEKCELIRFFKDTKIRRNIYPKSEGSNIYYGLSHCTFIELDLESNKVIRNVDIETNLKKIGNISKQTKNWIFVSLAQYYDSLFYFYTSKNSLCVFDPNTLEIEQEFNFEFKNGSTKLRGGLENFHINKNNIYCLDSDNTLHIIKR